MLKLQGHATPDALPTRGLHPLVAPFARSVEASRGVLGLLRWPIGKVGTTVVVSTHAQARDRDVDLASLTLKPMGTIAQFARRVAVETDASGGDAELVRAASAACVEAGGKAYEAGEFGKSKLGLPQFLLLKAGTGFPDVWAQLARYQLERGDETAALVAMERGTANNPGWACCLWQQAELLERVRRPEERRDMALAALEPPFWTLGAPLEHVLAAAQLSHVPDVRALMRAQEEAVRKQQRAPPRTTRELALLEVTELLDETVRARGRWDDVRTRVFEALHRGAFEEDAAVARGEGEGEGEGEARAKDAGGTGGTGSMGGATGDTGSSTSRGRSSRGSSPTSAASAEAASKTAPSATTAGSSTPLPLPPLVSPAEGAGTVRFLSCAVCGKATPSAMVCGRCECISYCSAACQAQDALKHLGTSADDQASTTCDDMGRYMKRDVRVHLGATEPAWLRASMDHRCEVSYCEVLEAMGVHQEESYRLLCGCASAPSPHRHLVDALDGAPTLTAPPTDWASYYASRGLSPASPLAVLLSFPLTVYHALTKLGLRDSARPLSVHYLGPEKELWLLPLFKELAVLMPSTTITIEMAGPVDVPLPESVKYDGRLGGSVTVRAHGGSGGWYHKAAPHLPPADVAIALNAGLAAREYLWSPSLDYLQQRRTPFFLTDYSEYSIERGVRRAQAHGLELSVPIELNPFRAPLRQPRVHNGAIGFPWVSNGFLAGFNTT
jgi:hypothetical protein